MLPDLDVTDADLLDEADLYEDETDVYDEDEDEDEDEVVPAQRSRAELDDESLRIRGVFDEHRALGRDVTPGGEQLHHYWTRGEGLAKWAKSPHPWTTLYHHLVKYVGPERAKRMASEWFHEVHGYWSGSDIHRVTSGKPPRGKRVGPG